jgi:hypothetical protein
MENSRASRLRRLAVVLAVAALGIGSSSWALAAGDGDPSRHRTGAQAAAPHLVGATGVACRVGYDTEAAALVPPDDSTTDNPPAATVTFSKKCSGVVLGVFSGEVTTMAGDFLHLDMRATCTGTGGYATHCTVGDQVFASPGHTFFQNDVAAVHDGSVQMVWTGLARGVWKFEVLPGGNNSANLQFRTFVVTAYSG